MSIYLVCGRWLLGAVLALSVVLPTVLQGVKLALMAAGILCIVPLLLKECASKRIWWPAVLLGLFYATLGLIGVIHGLIVGAPGAVSMATVHVAYPLIFSLLPFFLLSDDFGRFHSFFIKLTVVLVVTHLMHFASTFGMDGGVFSGFINLLYGDFAIIDPGEDYFLFSMPSVASYLFILPFLIVGYLLNPQRGRGLFLLVWIVAILCIFSGRRSFLVATSLAVFAVIILILSVGKGARPRVMGRLLILIAPVVPMLLIGVAVGLVNVDLMSDGIKGVFDFKGDSSNIERRLQFYSILDSVSDSPFFGSGAGSVAGYIRNPYMPWTYELHYLSVLFHFGFFSLILYALGCLAVLGGVIFHWRRASRLGDVGTAVATASFLAGLIGFLVGAGTNPYLAKFDYMWVIFLPFSILAAYKADLGRKVGAG
jgi:hypothetical protein